MKARVELVIRDEDGGSDRVYPSYAMSKNAQVQSSERSDML